MDEAGELGRDYSSSPWRRGVVAILAGSGGAEDDLVADIRLAGAECGPVLDYYAAIADPHGWSGCDGLIADFRGAPVELVEAVCSGLKPSAMPMLIDLDASALDSAYAILGDGDVEWLVAADQAERLVVMARFFGHAGQLFQADDDLDTADDLHALSEDIARIAERLKRIAGQEREPDESGLAENAMTFRVESAEEQYLAQAGQEPVRAVDVRGVIAMRQMRERYFDATLFADPAWDILLDLFAARLEGQPVSVSSLCIAAAVPPTTALRWIRVMTQQGLLSRHADRQDGRRSFIELDDMAYRRLHDYFLAVRERFDRAF
ncbi:MAG: MarR family transcriptional regulator [Blastomonas sp.]